MPRPRIQEVPIGTALLYERSHSPMSGRDPINPDAINPDRPEAPSVQPTASYFAVAGVALALALALLDPDSSSGLGFAVRLTYWLGHVGGALLLLTGLQRLLRPKTPQRAAGAALRVALVGVLGAVAFLPVAGVLEGFFFAQPASRLVEEAVEVVPQVFLFWMLLNLPFLRRLGRADSSQGARDGNEPPAEPGGAPAMRDEGAALVAALDLPPQLGHRLVAISSELHYLRTYTIEGTRSCSVVSRRWKTPVIYPRVSASIARTGLRPVRCGGW